MKISKKTDELRKELPHLLERVRWEGLHVEIVRYTQPQAVLVPVEWYAEAARRMEGREQGAHEASTPPLEPEAMDEEDQGFALAETPVATEAPAGPDIRQVIEQFRTQGAQESEIPGEPSEAELKAARDYYGLALGPDGLELTDGGMGSALGKVGSVIRKNPKSPDIPEVRILALPPHDPERLAFLRSVQVEKYESALAKRAAGDRGWLGPATPAPEAVAVLAPSGS